MMSWNKKNMIFHYFSISNHCNIHQHDLSPLLLVPMDDAKNTKKSRRSKCIVALLVSATAAAAAVVFLTHHSSSAAGVNSVASAFSSLMGTGRKIGESCDSPWWNACIEKLSCYDSGSSSGRYCVLMGQNNACCGYISDFEAPGIDCIAGLSCDSCNRSDKVHNTVLKCHPKDRRDEDNASFV